MHTLRIDTEESKFSFCSGSCLKGQLGLPRSWQPPHVYLGLFLSRRYDPDIVCIITNVEGNLQEIL